MKDHQFNQDNPFFWRAIFLKMNAMRTDAFARETAAKVAAHLGG